MQYRNLIKETIHTLQQQEKQTRTMQVYGN